MFDPKETEVQIALGSYTIWWIQINYQGYADPDWLQTVLKNHLPRYELWSSGNYKVWGVINHLITLSRDFHHRDPRISMHVTDCRDGKFEKVDVSAPQS